MIINDKRRILEISAVILTGVGKFIFMDWLNLRLPFISVAILFWIGYVFSRKKHNSKIIDYWGLNFKNFWRTFLQLLPIVILLVLGFMYYGNTKGTNILNWNIIPILILYPLWGIVQQFIMIGILAKNLKDIRSFDIPTYLTIIITAITFSMVHYPFNLLIIGTFFLAIVYTLLYFKGKNLIVLGIYHGWLGAFFFYTLLSRDPFLEVFNMLTL